MKRRKLLFSNEVVCRTISILVIASISAAISIQQVSAQFLDNPLEVIQQDEFIQDEASGILVRPYTNARGHVYPYTATVIALSCIIVVIVTIIVCGPNLG
jgi:hypothetical protein